MNRRKALGLAAVCVAVVIALLAPLWLIPDLSKATPAAARIRVQYVLDGGQDPEVHLSSDRTQATVNVNGTCFLVLVNDNKPGATSEVDSTECVPTLPPGR